MTALAHLVVLAVLFSALRGRWFWTRLGGVLLALAAVVGLWTAWSNEVVRLRLADPDLWPGVLFVVLASALSWWTMRREQEQTTPIHEEDEPESLSRFIPSSPFVLGFVLVVLVSAVVSAPVGVEPDSASQTIQDGPPVPWFLLGLAELSRHLGPLAAWVLVPLAITMALVATPFLDTSRPETDGPFRGRRDEAPFFLWAWLGLGLSPLVAALFLPAPSLSASTFPSTSTSSFPSPALAEWFWLDLVTRREPELWFVRELPGLAILAVIAIVLPLWLPRSKTTRGVFGRHLRRLGRRRYALLCGLLVVFMLVPVGLAVRACGFGPWLRMAGGWWL